MFALYDFKAAFALYYSHIICLIITTLHVVLVSTTVQYIKHVLWSYCHAIQYYYTRHTRTGGYLPEN